MSLVQALLCAALFLCGVLAGTLVGLILAKPC